MTDSIRTAVGYTLTTMQTIQNKRLKKVIAMGM